MRGGERERERERNGLESAAGGKDERIGGEEHVSRSLLDCGKQFVVRESWGADQGLRLLRLPLH